MGYGQHPASGYMVSDNMEVYALSTLDIIIDIKGMFFRCRSLSHAKNLNVTEEYGSGSLDPFALVNQEHAYSGSLTFASFLVDGSSALTTNDRLILRRSLLDQQDEGRATYFHIYTMEVPGRANGEQTSQELLNAIENRNDLSPTAAAGMMNFIEALFNCKVTKFNRDYADKGTIVSSIDFKYMYSLPA